MNPRYPITPSTPKQNLLALDTKKCKIYNSSSSNYSHTSSWETWKTNKNKYYIPYLISVFYNQITKNWLEIYINWLSNRNFFLCICAKLILLQKIVLFMSLDGIFFVAIRNIVLQRFNRRDRYVKVWRRIRSFLQTVVFICIKTCVCCENL